MSNTTGMWQADDYEGLKGNSYMMRLLGYGLCNAVQKSIDFDILVDFFHETSIVL